MFNEDVVYFHTEIDIDCLIQTEKVKRSANISGGEFSTRCMYSEIVTDLYLNFISKTFRTVCSFKYLFLFFDYLHIFWKKGFVSATGPA